MSHINAPTRMTFQISKKNPVVKKRVWDSPSKTKLNRKSHSIPPGTHTITQHPLKLRLCVDRYVQSAGVLVWLVVLEMTWSGGVKLVEAITPQGKTFCSNTSQTRTGASGPNGVMPKNFVRHLNQSRVSEGGAKIKSAQILVKLKNSTGYRLS